MRKYHFKENHAVYSDCQQVTPNYKCSRVWGLRNFCKFAVITKRLNFENTYTHFCIISRGYLNIRHVLLIITIVLCDFTPVLFDSSQHPQNYKRRNKSFNRFIEVKSLAIISFIIASSFICESPFFLKKWMESLKQHRAHCSQNSHLLLQIYSKCRLFEVNKHRFPCVAFAHWPAFSS